MLLQTVGGSTTQAVEKELPRTGIEALPMGLGGSLLVVVGIALVLEGRRREKKSLLVV